MSGVTPAAARVRPAGRSAGRGTWAASLGQLRLDEELEGKGVGEVLFQATYLSFCLSNFVQHISTLLSQISGSRYCSSRETTHYLIFLLQVQFDASALTSLLYSK